MATRPVFRFAPSPNGYLHLGHAYSALKNLELARRSGGRLLLRIEDTDLSRARPAFDRAIREDLAWLGIGWEEPVRRQSEHFDDYRGALDTLAAAGLLYPCFCSRSDVARAVAGRPDWPRDPDGEPLYPGTCRTISPETAARRLAAGEPAARRIDMHAALARAEAVTWDEYGEVSEPLLVAADPAAWGDAVVARRGSPASYTIAVVVDDALQGVTDVVRGQDLFAATSLQRMLQQRLGYAPPRYHHHALVRDEAGRKLSKSVASQSLRALREQGVTAADIRRRLGFAAEP